MTKLQVIEHNSQRVLTTAQLAEGYGADTQTVTNNYNRNKQRYAAGKHFYCLEGVELKAFAAATQIDLSPNVHKMYLWTEHGALLHAKSLGTDKAWEVYERLVETYFRAREMFEVPKSLSEALYLAAGLQKQIEENAPLVAFAETAARSKDSILIRELAKICCKNGIETGEKRLYAKLREWGHIMPGRTEPYQTFVDRGYYEVCEGTREANGMTHLYKVTRVLPKGQQYIMNRLRGSHAS
ncbi:phage antirepressor KilAC domain-containing protein [Christensenellaceae bacterium OttesenSCG-928-L17]|nr:phage antirepressor KilAC domain-containing protein [Christensenellaceae bacterium OttesenSCG-928-L17]